MTNDSDTGKESTDDFYISFFIVVTYFHFSHGYVFIGYLDN